MQQQITGAVEASTSTRCAHDTGLTPAEQQTRQAATLAWVRRMLRLMEQTGCSARHAFQAVEESDKVRP